MILTTILFTSNIAQRKMKCEHDFFSYSNFIFCKYQLSYFYRNTTINKNRMKSHLVKTIINYIYKSTSQIKLMCKYTQAAQNRGTTKIQKREAVVLCTCRFHFSCLKSKPSYSHSFIFSWCLCFGWAVSSAVRGRSDFFLYLEISWSCKI